MLQSGKPNFYTKFKHVPSFLLVIMKWKLGGSEVGCSAHSCNCHKFAPQSQAG